MPEELGYFRRNLPHYQSPDTTYFITFRLCNSLPKAIVMRLQAERESELEKVKYDRIMSYNIQKKYFSKYEHYLDRMLFGTPWLREGKIAQLVSDALHYWDKKRYDLICYCIMPNHVHLVLSVGQVSNLPYVLSPILHSIKRYTARKANILLKRTGAFWQHESYDHIVRDEDELLRILDYIRENPVKANLVENAEDWKWSYYSFGPKAIVKTDD